jgi:predicted ATP-binding protein involved in virulence
MFRKLEFKNFQPFADQTVDFPLPKEKGVVAEMHILTGVNGSGKTRLLCVPAAILGNTEHLDKLMAGSSLKTEIYVDTQAPKSNYNPLITIRGVNYTIYGRDKPSISSIFHRIPAFAYSGTAYIQDAKINVMTATPAPDRKICLSFTRPENQSQQVLQAIANLKIRTAMDNLNTAGKSSPSRAMRIVGALESTITDITGREFKFDVDGYAEPRITVHWGTDHLPFNLLPDGLRSIIGWLAHAVVMMDATLEGKGNPVDTPVVFLLDEIESHLHPSWQRRILPSFQRLFPKAWICVATHSPFVISSINHGWIHVLKTGKDGRVRMLAPVPAGKGGSYISVLEDIMGLDEWYDPETEELLARFRGKRNAAYAGDVSAQPAARELAAKIAGRSNELGFVMGRELAQMDKQLAK